MDSEAPGKGRRARLCRYRALWGSPASRGNSEGCKGARGHLCAVRELGLSARVAVDGVGVQGRVPAGGHTASQDSSPTETGLGGDMEKEGRLGLAASRVAWGLVKLEAGGRRPRCAPRTGAPRQRRVPAFRLALWRRETRSVSLGPGRRPKPRPGGRRRGGWGGQGGRPCARFAGLEPQQCGVDPQPVDDIRFPARVPY